MARSWCRRVGSQMRASTGAGFVRRGWGFRNWKGGTAEIVKGAKSRAAPLFSFRTALEKQVTIEECGFFEGKTADERR